MSARFVHWLLIAVFVVSQSAMTLALTSHAQVATLSDKDLAAYALPDGSLPVICLTPNEEGSATHATCEGCLCCSLDGAVFSLGLGVRNNLGDDLEPVSQQVAHSSRLCLERTRGPPLSV